MFILIEMKDVDPDDREYLKADLYFTKAQVKHEIIATAKAVKNDRNVRGKFIAALKAMSRNMNLAFKNVETLIETLRDIDIFDYKLIEHNSKIIVKLYISQFYLEMVKAVRKGGGFMFRNVGRDENQWIKTFSRETEKTYTKNYTVKDVTDKYPEDATKEDFFNS